MPSRDRRQLRDGGVLGEADLAEVRLVHAQEERGLRPDRSLVVGGARAVRRPDLVQPGARAGEHVGDAKAVADLDQLTARHEHVAAVGQRREGEQQRTCVVVDDERALRAGEPPQETGQMMLTGAAAAVDEVVFQVRVAKRHLGDAVDGGLGERRAAEIRVDEDAGCVQHAPELRPPAGLEPCKRAQRRGRRGRRRPGSPREPARAPFAQPRAPPGAARARDARLGAARRRRAGREASSETQCKQGCLLNYQRAQAHPARRHGRDPARRRHGGHRRRRPRRVLRRPAAAGRHRARGRASRSPSPSSSTAGGWTSRRDGCCASTSRRPSGPSRRQGGTPS